MFLEDEPHPSNESKALTPELLEQYKSERQRLMAQARELERLRQQVRTSAEREAATIVTTARRNVRQVLVDARRELLVLVAQLQAVGCDAQADEVGSRVVEGEAPIREISMPAAAETSRETGEGSNPSAIITGARRDVREVLLEAQAELLALSEEARELRARIARQHDAGREALAAASPEPDAIPEAVPDAVATVDEYPPDQPVAAAVPDAAPHDPLPVGVAPVGIAPIGIAQLGIERAELEQSREYGSLSSPPRVWVAVAAALFLVAVGLGLYMSSSRRTPAATVARETAARETAPSTPSESPREPVPKPVASTGPAPAADPSAVTVQVSVRRPAWIRTTIDGRADTGRVFAAGETRSLTATREIVLRAGDAGAVFVSMNGGNARALGADGQVITRRFARPVAPPPPAPVMTRAAVEGAPRSLAADAPPTDVGTSGNEDAAGTPQTGTAEREILRATQRWFEAYFGGDSVGMNDIATSDFSIVDDRPEGQRFPPTMRGIDRGLQQVRIEVAGESAVMSARLTERGQLNGQVQEHVALVSAAWVRSDGRWRLMGVRFADPGQDARLRP